MTTQSAMATPVPAENIASFEELIESLSAIAGFGEESGIALYLENFLVAKIYVNDKWENPGMTVM